MQSRARQDLGPEEEEAGAEVHDAHCGLARCPVGPFGSGSYKAHGVILRREDTIRFGFLDGHSGSSVDEGSEGGDPRRGKS